MRLRKYPPQIILLNGPPGSGKDTVGAALVEMLDLRGKTCKLMKFSEPLKSAVHAMFGAPLAADYYESTKDKPATIFRGRTPREMYIRVSEDMIKPILGSDHLGRVAARRATNYSDIDFIIFTDLGFDAEARPLIEKFGAENILIVHLIRKGTSFRDDSRNFVDLVDDGVELAEVENEDTPRWAAQEILDIYPHNATTGD